MEEQLITFDTAKLAKEKNFPQNLFNTGWYNRLGSYSGIVNLNEKGEEVYYDWDGYQKNTNIKVSKEEYEKCCSHSYSAPTQSLLQKWLREVHKIHIVIHDAFNKETLQISYYPILYPFIKNKDKDDGYEWLGDVWKNEYEEVLEKGLQEALKLIKTK